MVFESIHHLGNEGMI